MSYPYDGLSDSELTAIINKARPPMVPNPKYRFKDDDSQAKIESPYPEGHFGRDMAQAFANAQRDFERMVLFGEKEGSSHIDPPADEWTQYGPLTGYIGGHADYPIWKQENVASLSRDAKLALIEKLNQLDKEGK